MKIYVAFFDIINFENTLIGVFPTLEKAKKALFEIPNVKKLKWETNDAGTIHSACVRDGHDEVIVSYDIFETELGKRADYAVSVYY